jgi:hypothetical protein
MAKFNVEDMDVEGFFDESEQNPDDAESENLRQELMKMIKGSGNPSNDDDTDGEDIHAIHFFFSLAILP